MIRFIVLPGHLYTLDGFTAPPAGIAPPPVELWTYRQLFEARALPPGTWIFCDIERLAVWELRLAGEVARLMRSAPDGFRILNDPALAAARYEVLFRLHDEGFNQFRAWRADDGIPPARFPVFLRLEANHRRPLTGLIDSPDALAAELEALAGMGIPRRGTLIIEYAPDECGSGVFRKFGAYRFGDRIVADHMVHDVTWVAKYGELAAWSDERFAQELAYVRDNPHADALMKAFRIAGLEYGRADYGMVDGVPQIWEINTNPVVPGGDPSKALPQRVEATVLARTNRLAGLAGIDFASDGPLLALDSPVFDAHRHLQTGAFRDLVRD